MRARYTAQIARQVLTLAPKLARGPIAIVPFRAKAQVLERLLGLILSEQAKDGELDFLSGKWVGINIEDLKLEFEVSYDLGWQVRPQASPEVIFSANSQELVLVAAGKEDPDTLFFQRKLGIEGDTELGLEVKNLLLSVEFDAMPAAIRLAVEQLAAMITRLQQTAMPDSVYG